MEEVQIFTQFKYPKNVTRTRSVHISHLFKCTEHTTQQKKVQESNVEQRNSSFKILNSSSNIPLPLSWWKVKQKVQTFTELKIELFYSSFIDFYSLTPFWNWLSFMFILIESQRNITFFYKEKKETLYQLVKPIFLTHMLFLNYTD